MAASIFLALKRQYFPNGLYLFKLLRIFNEYESWAEESALGPSSTMRELAGARCPCTYLYSYHQYNKRLKALALLY